MPKIPWITLEWPWPVLGLQPPFPVIMCYSLYLWVSLWQPLQWLIVIIPLFCLLVRTVLFYFLNYRPWPQKSRVLILVCTPFCTSRLCRRWKKCIHVSCSRIFNILCWVLFLFFNVLILLTPECLHSVFHFQVDLDDICGDISAGVYWLGGSFPRSVWSPHSPLTRRPVPWLFEHWSLTVWLKWLCFNDEWRKLC